MSRRCCIRTCRELSAESLLNGEPQPRCYRIPGDAVTKARWDLFINQANRTETFRGSQQVVCARHFQSSCFSDTGRLLPKSVPTIADRFTLEVAMKFHVTRDLGTTDLNVINNFTNTVVQLRDCEPGYTTIELQEAGDIALSNTYCVKEEVEEPVCVGELILLPDNSVCPCTSDSTSSKDPLTDVQDTKQENHGPNACLQEEPNLGSPLGTSPVQVCDRNPETSSTESETSKTARLQRRKRKFSSCELSTEDFATPRRRRANVERVQKKLTALRRQLKTEKQKCRRVEQKLRSLIKVIAVLKKRTPNFR